MPSVQIATRDVGIPQQHRPNRVPPSKAPYYTPPTNANNTSKLTRNQHFPSVGTVSDSLPAAINLPQRLWFYQQARHDETHNVKAKP